MLYIYTYVYMQIPSTSSKIGLLKCVRPFAVASKPGWTFLLSIPGISWSRVPELLSGNVKSRSGKRWFWIYHRNSFLPLRSSESVQQKFKGSTFSLLYHPSTSFESPIGAIEHVCPNRNWGVRLAWIIPKSPLYYMLHGCDEKKVTHKFLLLLLLLMLMLMLLLLMLLLLLLLLLLLVFLVHMKGFHLNSIQATNLDSFATHLLLLVVVSSDTELLQCKVLVVVEPINPSNPNQFYAILGKPTGQLSSLKRKKTYHHPYHRHRRQGHQHPHHHHLQEAQILGLTSCIWNLL